MPHNGIRLGINTHKASSNFCAHFMNTKEQLTPIVFDKSNFKDGSVVLGVLMINS